MSRTSHVFLFFLLISGCGTLPTAAAIIVGGEPDPSFNSDAMQFWYRADLGVDNPGGAVAQWDDQSNYGRDAVQANAANQPTHSDSGLGGREVINFSEVGDADFLDTAFNPVDALNESFTLFSVIAPNDGTADGNAWFGNFELGGDPDAFANIDGSTLSLNYFNGSGGNSFLNPSNPFPATPTDYAIITWVMDGVNDTQTVYIDSVEVTQKTETIDMSLFSNSDSPYLGAVNRSGSALLPFDGGISEMLLYKGALSQADREAVEDYLRGEVIPEPSSLTIAGLVAGLGFFRRR